jgi:hypothetical protein
VLAQPCRVDHQARVQDAFLPGLAADDSNLGHAVSGPDDRLNDVVTFHERHVLDRLDPPPDTSLQ